MLRRWNAVTRTTRAGGPRRVGPDRRNSGRVIEPGTVTSDVTASVAVPHGRGAPRERSTGESDLHRAVHVPGGEYRLRNRVACRAFD